VKLSDIKVPEGVTLTALAHEGEDQTVAIIAAPQREEVEEAEDEEDLEGVAAEASEDEKPDSEDEK